VPDRRQAANVVVPERKPDSDRRHKKRRWEDRRRVGIQRLWMAALTVLYIYGGISLQQAQNDQHAASREALRQRCNLTKAVIQTARDLGAPEKGLTKLKINRDACLKLLGKLTATD
jgi:hypothetical protein